MKLPIYKFLQKELSVEQINTAVEVLEKYSEAPRLADQEMEVIGELISNLLGAAEMHGLIASGMDEKEAANTFMKRVLGSIGK